ncbi:hypothetical protein GCM10011282_31630 [Undibacterium macrobrachii]|jgi:DNA polymerase III psi subunit|uniref:Uncharacterized protein n=1 Tax=Undibacterium macrobrachii TaxID=1119058 RepID=A0ABQ2XLR2_9BURK|nr:hypothetical protein GCM10011282_31630 [Undibacterium macrobrachii]
MNIDNMRLSHTQMTIEASRLKCVLVEIKIEIDIRLLTLADEENEITDAEITEILAEDRSHNQ